MSNKLYKPKRGDILLYSGTFFWSILIKMITGSKWSHVAWVWDENTILESDATTGGVVLTPMEKYLKQPKKIKFVRPVNILEEEKELALQSAYKHLGEPYDYFNIFQLLIMIILSWWGRSYHPFDLFGKKNTCVELVGVNLYLANKNWTPNENITIFEIIPGDFDNSPNTVDISLLKDFVEDN